ncbi:MAG: hypothetical protein FWG10_01395 [Eubacteriaceae bacterium]|nr:hypothetical protein [Eubacteriaceae bacterium]
MQGEANLGWWHEKDWLDPNQWVMSGVEVSGTTGNMCWVMNTVTGDSGLFKPESQWRRSAYSEYAASKIAEALEIPSAKILVGKLFGASGCISLDVRKGCSDHVLTCGSLLRCGGLLNRKKSDGNEMVYDNPGEMSFQGLLPYLPPDAELGMAKMMFFDAVIKNSGRHGSNFMFAIDHRRAISGFLPLYDHGNALQQGVSRWGRGRREGSAFAYHGYASMRQTFPFDDLYACLRRDYPALVGSLVAKLRSGGFREATAKLECYDFIIERLNNLERGEK